MLRSIFKAVQGAKRNRIISRYYDIMNALSALGPELVTKVDGGKKLLVLAPHCDDESAGCGGTIYKYHLQGGRVTVVFLTDGARCATDLSHSEIVALRQKEAKKAGDILGIDRLIFLGHPDRELKKTKESVSQIEQILSEIKPDAVLLPFFLDNHPDHRAVAPILAEAAKSFTDTPVFLYEVWSALIPNQIIDISEVADKKVEALNCYQSQDVATMIPQITALSQYRALSLGNGWKYAEGFFKTTSHDLCKFF